MFNIMLEVIDWKYSRFREVVVSFVFMVMGSGKVGYVDVVENL